MKRTGAALLVLGLTLGLSSVIPGTPEGLVVLGSASAIVFVVCLVVWIKYWNSAKAENA